LSFPGARNRALSFRDVGGLSSAFDAWADRRLLGSKVDLSRASWPLPSRCSIRAQGINSCTLSGSLLFRPAVAVLFYLGS
jgi:hypothetical protein